MRQWDTVNFQTIEVCTANLLLCAGPIYDVSLNRYLLVLVLVSDGRRVQSELMVPHFYQVCSWTCWQFLRHCLRSFSIFCYWNGNGCRNHFRSSRLVDAFVMGTAWQCILVSFFLLIFCSQCPPRARPFVKVGGARAPRVLWSRRPCSWYDSFIGTKVLGTFAPEERKFHGSESSLYGFFAPGNESAEERKGLESFIISHMTSKHILTKDQLPCRLLSFYILTFIYHDDVQTTVYIRAAPLNKYSSSSLNNRQLPVILMVMSVCVWLWGWTVGYIYIMTDSAGCRLYDTKSTLYDCYLYGYMYFGLLLCLAALFYSPVDFTDASDMH